MIALPSLQSFTFTRSTPFHVALVVLVIAFHLSTPRCTTVKQRAWVLTTISSAVMSVASLPLAWEYLVSCFDLLSVQKSNMWTYCASRFFQAYLIAFVSFHISHTFTSLTLYRDISLGLIYYRSKVNFLTGWVHHTVYVFIVEYAIRKNWSYIFCLCAVMEVRSSHATASSAPSPVLTASTQIPTFVLASASLDPRLRSDAVFATTFFLTRIVLHVALGISLIARRVEVIDGSLGPGAIMACIFPLHVFWFTGCVKGFVKRTESNQGTKLVPSPSAPGRTHSKYHAFVDARTDRPRGTPLAEHMPSPSISPHASIHISPRSSGFSRRRTALRVAVRQRWDQFSLSRAGRRIGEMQRQLRAALPAPAFVYEYVGVERAAQRTAVSLVGGAEVVGVRASSPSPSPPPMVSS